MRLSTRWGRSRLSFSSFATQRSTTPFRDSTCCWAADRPCCRAAFSVFRPRPSSAACWHSRWDRCSSSTRRRCSSDSLRRAAALRLSSRSSASSCTVCDSPLSCRDSTRACSRWIVPWSESFSSRSRADSSCMLSSCASVSRSRCSSWAPKPRYWRSSSASICSCCSSAAFCRRLVDSSFRCWCACCHWAFTRENSRSCPSSSVFFWESRDRFWFVTRRVSNCVISELQRSVSALTCWRCSSFWRASSAHLSPALSRSPCRPCARCSASSARFWRCATCCDSASRSCTSLAVSAAASPPASRTRRASRHCLKRPSCSTSSWSRAFRRVLRRSTCVCKRRSG
mmetsp:Transcript_8347/g.23504  ORF Transcript_8347/g.23504 Transcript_8347/m.23504 type:complete len:341 (-) Transcript_8347:3529-4551(-)